MQTDAYSLRRVSDIVCNQNPLTLLHTAGVREACRRMKERKTGSVLVVDEQGSLVGIFTGRDAVRRVLAKGRSGETSLLQVMTRNPITMSPDKTAIDALRLMWDGGFRHVPIIAGKKIVGVISRGDFRSDEQLALDEERQLWEHMR
jgi:CBS domain-containing protein